ncbi:MULTISPECIES: endonuclease domain-containing protein [Streptomyces]|uniref:endonuclease domain-containing protein n=1 Tax=Streptomyces TaxID=1883 RepID=UPI00131CE1EC
MFDGIAPDQWCPLCEDWVCSLVRGRVCRKCRQLQRRMWRYGLTIARYNAILRSQDFACALCGDNEEEDDFGIPHAKMSHWHIDHDHACCGPGSSCGKCVRGLLCRKCNMEYLPAYERLPMHMRDSPLFNTYLAAPPAQQSAAQVIPGRDNMYLPTSHAFLMDRKFADGLESVAG